MSIHHKKRTQIPFFVDRDERTHMFVCGKTGSGKTFRVAIPMYRQIAAQQSSNIIVIDGKGSQLLHKACAQIAEEAGRRFWVLSLNHHHPTHVFNAFGQGVPGHKPNLTTVVETTQHALSLTYPEGYGPSYFANAIRSLMRKSMVDDTGLSSRPNNRPPVASTRMAEIDSWQHLIQRIRSAAAGDEKLFRDSLALIHKCEALTELPQLCPDERVPDEAINNQLRMSEFVRPDDDGAYRNMLYVSCRVAEAPMMARMLAHLVLDKFREAAYEYQDIYGKPTQADIFIDEMQFLVGSGLKNFYEQIREAGGLVCAGCQEPSQLTTSHAGDMFGSVIENSGTLIAFTAKTPPIATVLQDASGEQIYHLGQYDVHAHDFFRGNTGAEYALRDVRSMAGGGQYITNRIAVTETVAPRISGNDLGRVTNTPGQAFVWVTDGPLGGIPVPMRFPFDRSKLAFEQLAELPFPRPVGSFRPVDIEPELEQKRPRGQVATHLDEIMRQEFGDDFEAVVDNVSDERERQF